MNDYSRDQEIMVIASCQSVKPDHSGGKSTRAVAHQRLNDSPSYYDLLFFTKAFFLQIAVRLLDYNDHRCALGTGFVILVSFCGNLDRDRICAFWRSFRHGNSAGIFIYGEVLCIFLFADFHL